MRAKSHATRTRSFACPDDLWDQVKAFAKESGLGTPSVAARALLQTALKLQERSRTVAAARDWQIAQAWAEVQAIASGDRKFGSWREIDRAVARARRSIRAKSKA